MVRKPSARPVPPPPPGSAPSRVEPPAQEARSPRAPEPSLVRGPRVEDVYVFIAVASANNPTGRWSEPAFVRRGWTAIVDDHVIRRYMPGGGGYRRFYVDSPFGKETDAKGVPQFGFFGGVRVSPESPWRKGFIDAWRRATRLSGIKVVAYLGNPYTDAEFKRVLAAEGRGAALRMLRDAVAPIRLAGFHGLGIDASYATEEESPLADLMKELQDEGMEVYVEGPPSAAQPWLTRFGVIRTTWMARTMDEAKEAASRKPGGGARPLGVIDPKECRGERIQLHNGTAPWKSAEGKPWGDWGPRWIRECLAQGEYPALGLSSFPGDGKRAIGVE